MGFPCGISVWDFQSSPRSDFSSFAFSICPIRSSSCPTDLIYCIIDVPVMTTHADKDDDDEDDEEEDDDNEEKEGDNDEEIEEEPGGGSPTAAHHSFRS